MNNKVIEKVKLFVEDFNKQKRIVRSSSSYEIDIAKAVNEFEIIDSKDEMYHDSIIERLNILINTVVAKNELIDSNIAEKLENLEIKCNKLESDIKEKDIILEKACSDRDYYKGQFELYDRHFKGMFGNKLQDGDIEPNESG